MPSAVCSRTTFFWMSLFVLLQDGFAVRRPDYLSRARLAPRTEDETELPVVKNKDPSGLKVYVGPNYKERVSPVSHVPAMFTSSKCCKIGERVAKEGMHCKFDIISATRNMNHVHSAKLKQQAQGEHGYPDHRGIMASVYKGLTLKVTKCYQHKDMFEKCCNYRTSFLMMMRKCRDMKGPDRKQCRTKTRKSFGY